VAAVNARQQVRAQCNDFLLGFLFIYSTAGFCFERVDRSPPVDRFSSYTVPESAFPGARKLNCLIRLQQGKTIVYSVAGVIFRRFLSF
jgi:hypothetical protein